MTECGKEEGKATRSKMEMTRAFKEGKLQNARLNHERKTKKIHRLPMDAHDLLNSGCAKKKSQGQARRLLRIGK